MAGRSFKLLGVTFILEAAAFDWPPRPSKGRDNVNCFACSSVSGSLHWLVPFYWCAPAGRTGGRHTITTLVHC